VVVIVTDINQSPKDFPRNGVAPAENVAPFARVFSPAVAPPCASVFCDTFVCLLGLDVFIAFALKLICKERRKGFGQRKWIHPLADAAVHLRAPVWATDRVTRGTDQRHSVTSCRDVLDQEAVLLYVNIYMVEHPLSLSKKRTNQ
jgi:hypothetical protein